MFAISRGFGRRLRVHQCQMAVYRVAGAAGSTMWLKWQTSLHSRSIGGK